MTDEMPTFTHTHKPHTHAKVQTSHLSKAPPNYELLHTTMRTMRGPWPPHNQPQGVPPLPHTPHTQWPLQSQGSHYAIPSHKDTHQSLSCQERIKNDRSGRRKIGNLGETWTNKTQMLEYSVYCRVVDNIREKERERHTVSKLRFFVYVLITRV